MTILLYVMIGTLLIVTIVAMLTMTLNIHYSKKLKDFHSIFLGKLVDNQEDDIVVAMQYLKLTNSIQTEKISN